MAKFKIYLLNMQNYENQFSPRYSLIPISDFTTEFHEANETRKIPISMSQLASIENTNNYRDKEKYFTAQLKQNNEFCYTYDEKFQIHQNTQRTLTFSMNREVIRIDRIEKNPFINYLFIGAQLLLIDKYDNHHLMTVSKISYDFKSHNTVFKYECQDSFNYQLSRQNTGYELENNVEDTNFIGAQTLDWWVLCKIHPECKISYQYLKLDQSNLNIKKEAYTYELYPDLHRTVPFSASGTANSVLIALGELYELQLRVYERINLDTNSAEYGTCKKYYWFDPVKSLRPTGLKYSPYLDLQTFSLEHNSTSFSSILNIQNNTINDEVITVLPSVPSFFRQWFETKEWDQSSFVPGLFSKACQETIDVLVFNQQKVESIQEELELLPEELKTPLLKNYYDNDTVFYDKNSGYVYIPIKSLVNNRHYQYLKFTTSNGDHSIFNVTGVAIDAEAKEPESIPYNSKFVSWEVHYKISDGTDIDNNDIQFSPDIIYTKQTEIPIENISKYGIDYCFLRLYAKENYENFVIDGEIYTSYYRIPSKEELEFAMIADQLPWLENKLINFHYFYEHSIITLSEYNQLMQLLENNLRKTNAKLLVYSELYYKAIQNKTKILSALSSKIDKVGAVFQSELVNPFMIDGRAGTTTEFSLAMSDLFANSVEPIRLLTYYETLSDYVNKYFTAEQTFLKNMYLFREYFESKSALGTLYSYDFTLLNSQLNDNQIISFTTPNNYAKLTKENSFNPIYEKQDQTYILYDKNEILTDKNYKKHGFYYLDPQSSGKILIDEQKTKYHGYNDSQVYYELQWETQDGDFINHVFKQEDDKHSTFKYISLFTTEWFEFSCTLIEPGIARIACRDHCLHTIKTPETFKYSGGIPIDGVKPVYVKVDYTALRANLFYQELNNTTNRSLLYMHRRNNDWETAALRSVSNWKSFSELGIDGSLLEALGETKNLDSDDLKNLAIEPAVADKVYKQCFPISSYYWYGKEKPTGPNDYHSVPFVNIENVSQFYRRVSVSLDTYKGWQIGLAIGGAAAALGLVPFILPGTVLSIAAAPAIWGICQACWNNGEKPFNNTGWSFHDIFNCDIDAFQGWSDSDRLLYTKTPEGYTQTAGKKIFPKNISGETWTENVSKIEEKQWGYNEATNLLLTYYSLSNRLTENLKKKYFYETTYYRILGPKDYIHKNDSLSMLWYSNNEINKERLITVDQTLAISNKAKKQIKRLDTVIYYPLKNHISTISGTSFSWPDNKKYMKLEKLLEANQMTKYKKFETDDEYVFIDSETNGTNDSGARVIYLKEETWTYDDITEMNWENVGYENIAKIAASNWYDNNTFELVNLITSYPKMTVGFYIIGTDEDDYIPTVYLNQLSENKQYYKKINNLYERRYTIDQLINKQDMYVKLSDVYHHDSFSEVEQLTVQYHIYNQQQVGEKIFNFDLQTSSVGVLKKDSGTWYLYGDNFKQECSCNVSMNDDLKNYTKGAFWYKYKNHSNTLLMEKAMLIETNLMEYWTNAYYASKNCKYFIPEYWQPTVDQQKNYFSRDIINFQEETIRKTIENKTVELIDIKKPLEQHNLYKTTRNFIEGYIETIIEVKNDNSYFSSIKVQLENDPNKTHNGILEYHLTGNNKVSFTYKDQQGFSNSITFELNNEGTEFTVIEDHRANNHWWSGAIKISLYIVSSQQQTTKTHSLGLSSIYIPQVKKLPEGWRYQLKHELISHNIEDTYAEVHNLRVHESIGLNRLIQSTGPIRDVVNYLNIDATNWKAIKLQEDYILYEHISGGTLWTQMLDKLSGSALLNNRFGGWYDMMIKVLQTCNYENYDPIQYQQAKQEHDTIWREIYTKYPHLCYEQSYTNEDATSSKELLQLAQWAFRDYTAPESNYNISVIDLNTLKGYRGQELKIGDGIEVEAREIYNDMDSDIYKSLIQYLYITDINYDLRKDDGIQLTINTIKYSNRVIKDLVKLIR